ncbi:MAG: hypothetical protein COB15_01655 [Flavobacteriales bacterium]|nr:MAG: hypothetical protein COB15_01655 [Flavobacteriales bacterium]
MNEEMIASINKVIAAYFKNNPEVEWIAVKKLMPELIAEGVFYKDEKKGLPLRNVLRALDKEKALDKIPTVHAERRGIDTYWYIVREGAQYVSKDVALPESNKEKARLKRVNSDEYYLIGLCNELLNQEAAHQYTFKFLLGDYHKDGETRTALPVDAYYTKLKMVIELFEVEDTTSLEEEKNTISGVKRSEQRKKYAQRKVEFLENKGIHLVEIGYNEFECDKENKLVRNKEADVKILQEILKEYLLDKKSK